ncbi:hypothetical protein AG1IA_09926 [Rhizoctonia solani AG-1 IA]|uniref:Nephrocystin 3-like N-terminal domain-containing protein n=1 Tax=Thanatephorus cucumeris (strain AG1-IA) TaxID=983506 RepID=L8WGY5_THACA|nr:hypothetical protein AG1IA_09926 [Rhizoctonia solani AG-1 IA]
MHQRHTSQHPLQAQVLGVCLGPKGGVLDERDGWHQQDHHCMHLCQMAQDQETPSGKLLLHKDISYQLVQYCIPFQLALCNVIGHNPDLGTKDIRTQFERLLVDPLNKIKNNIPSNLVVVINALDKCNNQQGVEQVLDILFKHASQDLHNNDNTRNVTRSNIPTQHQKVTGQRGYPVVPKAGAWFEDPQAVG